MLRYFVRDLCMFVCMCVASYLQKVMLFLSLSDTSGLVPFFQMFKFYSHLHV